MAVFEGEVLRQTIGVAIKHKVEPAAALAVVEVESAGKSLEQDGRTPRLLFERHVFYRELKKAGKTTALSRAVAAGLAHPEWRKPGTANSQYRDQGTSAKRLSLLARARAIDEECALRSCSWGVGQTMGFNAEEMGFRNARELFQYMVEGGVPAQVECMFREIEEKKLIGKMNAHDWAGFAYKYNGAGYKANKYDTKMAAAYLKWKKVELPKITEPVPKPKPVQVEPGTSKPTKPEVKPTPPVVTKEKGGLFAGIAAFFAGLWAALQTTQFQLVGIVVMICVLTVITVVVLNKRRAAAATAVPLGMLSISDDEGISEELPMREV